MGATSRGRAGQRGEGVAAVGDRAQQRAQARLEMQHGGLVAIDAHRDVERVGGVADDGGAVAQQRVGARRAPRRDRAGDRADVAPDVGAISAVMSEPERRAASTTIVMCASAAMIRLRAGKHQRSATNPGGSSPTTQPRSPMSSCRRALLGG